MAAFSGYRKIIDAFKAGQFSEREIERRLSDLMLLADFSASLTRETDVKEIADLLLLTVMGSTTTRRAVFLLHDSPVFRVIASRGYRSRQLPEETSAAFEQDRLYYIDSTTSLPAWQPFTAAWSLRMILPLRQDGRVLGLLGLGERTDGGTESEHEKEVLESLAQMCGPALQNVLGRRKIDDVNRELSVKVHQLNTLFELSKDFYSLWESDTVFHILGNTLIGQLATAKCAVLVFSGEELLPKFVKGFRIGPDHLDYLKREPALNALMQARVPIDTEIEVPEVLRDLLEELNVAVIVPLIFNEKLRGMILLGRRVNRKPFTRDEYDLISTLSTLALASEESIRMQRLMIEKERMEKELALAREIQMSLLPATTPEIPGFEVCSLFQPCYQVGGDYFDFLPVSDHEMAIAIGDVSGKGMPAAMIMASVQASLRTVVAMKETNPRLTIQQINQILSDRQSRKYVTFVYGILNVATSQLEYVNAGHCYPLIVRASGGVERLETGGTVIGFFHDAKYQTGSVSLQPGDLMILYTDGVSELMNPQEEEFEPAGIIRTLVENRHRPVPEIKDALIAALDDHRKNLEPGDDITFLLLKRKLE